jgi:hypothetical protein
MFQKFCPTHEFEMTSQVALGQTFVSGSIALDVVTTSGLPMVTGSAQWPAGS